MSFVISHCLTDGVGLCEALADAAFGRDNMITWPQRYHATVAGATRGHPPNRAGHPRYRPRVIAMARS